LPSKKIVCGKEHTVLLDENGNAWAWGHNNYGQCGVGSKDVIVKEPTQVNLSNVVDIACGVNHTLFLTKDGTVHACGLSKDDRFPSKSEHIDKPTKVEGFDKHKIVAISCGKRHNLFLAQ